MRKRARGRTLAARRADEEARLAQFFALNDEMALTDLAEVSDRLHDLHRRLDLREGRHVTQYELAEWLNIPHRTFQSWEGGKVETDGENYDKVAALYSEKLGEPVTRNWILFGSEDEPPLHGPGADDEVTERLEQVEGELQALRELLEPIAARLLEADEEDALRRSSPSEKLFDDSALAA